MWLDYFASIDAPSLTHAEIASHLSTDTDVSDWWAQMLTVEYEQHLERRVPGQDHAGQFAVSVTRTIDDGMDETLNWWLSVVEGIDSFADVPLAETPEVTRSDKWRYWRVPLIDESRIVANITDRPSGKSRFTVTHEKLKTAEMREHSREYWQEFLDTALAIRGQDTSIL